MLIRVFCFPRSRVHVIAVYISLFFSHRMVVDYFNDTCQFHVSHLQNRLVYVNGSSHTDSVVRFRSRGLLSLIYTAFRHIRSDYGAPRVWELVNNSLCALLASIVRQAESSAGSCGTRPTRRDIRRATLAQVLGLWRRCSHGRGHGMPCG